MKNLKTISIIGLIIYPIILLITIFISIRLFKLLEMYDNYILSCFLSIFLILYAIFNSIIGCINGYKYKKISLLIISNVICLIFGMYLFIFFLLLFNNDSGYLKHDQFIGILFTSFPFAITISIITLVISSKILRKK